MSIMERRFQLSTNKAFDCYLHVEHEKMRNLYREARPGKTTDKVVSLLR